MHFQEVEFTLSVLDTQRAEEKEVKTFDQQSPKLERSTENDKREHVG